MLRQFTIPIALLSILAYGGTWAETGTGIAITVPVASDSSVPLLGPIELRIIASEGPEPGAGFGPTGSSQPSVGPSARSFHAMAYDAESDRIILFGGWAGGSTSETWAYNYDANTWAQMSPPVAPSPRDAHAMAYDAGSDRVILFGGATAAGGVFPDTWAYDLNNDAWINMVPAGRPPARLGARMVYEANSDRIILFGGHNGECYGDTWAYDFDNNTWSEMGPATAPTPRAWQAMVYVESSGIVLFGGDPCSGFNPNDDYDDTWTYDVVTNNWTKLNPVDKPGMRGFSAAAFDSDSDRIVLFGGNSDPGQDETWVYNPNENTWTQMDVNPRPSGRNVHAMTYDGESDRIVLFGGSWPPGLVNDPSIRHNNETWAYDSNTNTWSPLSPLVLPGAPRNLEASPGDGVIELAWQAPMDDGGYAVTDYRVYRGTDSGSLSFLDEVESSFAYTDSSVTVGSTYLYQVRAVTRAGEGPPSNEAFVTVPDDLNPTVTITSPTEGETVNTSSITASGTATDNVAVETVEVSTDGSAWTAATMGDTSWSASLDLEEGLNTIHARAIDTSGNDAATSVSVTYPPTPNEPEGVDPRLIAGIIGGVAVAAIAVGVFLFRRRS